MVRCDPSPRARWLQAVALALLASLGAACAFPAQPVGMVPPAMSSLTPRSPVTVNVQTFGGLETHLWGRSKISDRALHEAVLRALHESGFMQPVDDRVSDYRLDVAIETLQQPWWGFVMTVRVRTLWILRRDGQIFWKERFEGQDTQTLFDAVIGTKRCRLATEGAARLAIDQAIREMALLQL